MLAALLGMAAIALGSLMCGPGCSPSCKNRETTLFLSFAGGLVLAATVAENVNLLREHRQRRSRRER